MQFPGLEDPAAALRAGGSARAFGVLGKFLGRTVSEAAAFSAGIALGPVLGPVVQALRNTVNSKYAFVYPDAGTLAQGVAQGQIDEKTARQWASYHGIGDDAFSGLRAVADTGPPLGSALTLLRRGVWLPGQYNTALHRAAIERQWWEGLGELRDEWLSPDELAVMVQRTVVPNPGLLPNQPSTEGSNVPPMPMADIDTLAEAAGGGISRERLAAKARIIGLPASPDLAARMTFRNIITEGAFNQAILEGNTRGEWAPFLLEGFRQILTPTEYAELDLRGWINHDERDAGASKHGMSAEDADLLWKLHGRPLNIHQITTGLARGGKYNPVPGELADPYQAAVRLGSLRPEYYDLDIANKYTLPSAFVMRQLTQSGVWDEAKAAERLKWAGWIPEDANEAAAAWAKGSGAKTGKEETAPQLRAERDGWYTDDARLRADLEALGYDATVAARVATLTDAARVKGYVDKAVEKVYKAFIGKAITETQARDGLATLRLHPAAIDNLVSVWDYVVALESTTPPVA